MYFYSSKFTFISNSACVYMNRSDRLCVWMYKSTLKIFSYRLCGSVASISDVGFWRRVGKAVSE